MSRMDPTTFLHFLMTAAGGRPDPPAPVHRDLQEFLTRHRMALVELPRDHGKTTQVCGRILWELGHNPELRVKLVCATDAIATERTRFLRDAIATNPAVREVFPRLRPAAPWTAAAFTVARRGQTIGPSVAAFGVGTGATGTRADLLVCDDVVDVRSVTSWADRERVKEYFRNNLINLLEPDGRFWGLATPWHPDDLTAHLRADPAYAKFRRAVGAELAPVWPGKWPPARLAVRRAEVGTAAFARGYLLNPVSSADVTVRPEWVKFWTEELPRSAYELVVLAVDPAVSAQESADASGLVVLGKVQNQVHCLAATGRRVTAPGLAELIDRLDRTWTPDVILFESNAAFAGIRDLLVWHARYGPKVTGVTQSRSKPARLAGLAVAVENGSVRLRGNGMTVDASQRGLFDELTRYPYHGTDDLADALATGAAHLIARPQPRAWLM